MNRKWIRYSLIAVGLLGVLLLAAALIVPFLIPIPPLEGLVTPTEAADENSQFVTVPFDGTDGIELHYLTGAEDDTAADEPTFILLHGSLFNAFTWTDTLADFDAVGRVLAYDQVPYGLSEKLVAGDWTGDNPYSMDAAVTQLFAFMDVMDVESAVLVGNSYGAVLALEAAYQQPERVDALVLADAAVYVNESVPQGLIDTPQVQRVGTLFARSIGTSEGFVRQTYRNPDLLSDERLERTLIHTQVVNWDAALWAYLQVWGANPSDIATVLGEIQTPALVLTGDSDAIVPVTDSERLAAALSDAPLVILPECGHIPQEECPQAFMAAVTEWVMPTLSE
jgi:pimeloyl-ACP methyl ester carboxylesterase